MPREHPHRVAEGPGGRERDRTGVDVLVALPRLGVLEVDDPVGGDLVELVDDPVEDLDVDLVDREATEADDRPDLDARAERRRLPPLADSTWVTRTWATPPDPRR